MPDIDLSKVIPPAAQWIKLHYNMTAKKEGADLIARVWSGKMEDAQVIKGPSGDLFVRIDHPQRVSYQRPVTVDLQLKVVAYKEKEEEQK